jgi:hypothetical protein
MEISILCVRSVRVASQEDQDDLLDALFNMNRVAGKRPSIIEARLRYFQDWSRERLLDAAKALEANGDILNPTQGLLNVDLSSTARRKAAARASGLPAQAPSTTYNIGSMQNSPLQHVAADAHGVQNTTYQMTANDLRAVVDLYRRHVED